MVEDHCDSFGPTGWQSHFSVGATQFRAVQSRSKTISQDRGELQSSADMFPLYMVFLASRWKDAPYRVSVIGSQPALPIFHSWHQDKPIFFTKLTPITFIFIAHNQLIGYNLIQAIHTTACFTAQNQKKKTELKPKCPPVGVG